MFIRISTMIQPCDLTDFLNSCVFGKVQLSNLSIMIWQCFWSSMEALVYCTEIFLFIMSLLVNILSFYAFTHQSKFLFKKTSLMVIFLTFPPKNVVATRFSAVFGCVILRFLMGKKKTSSQKWNKKGKNLGKIGGSHEFTNFL